MRYTFAKVTNFFVYLKTFPEEYCIEHEKKQLQRFPTQQLYGF